MRSFGLSAAALLLVAANGVVAQSLSLDLGGGTVGNIRPSTAAAADSAAPASSLSIDLGSGGTQAASATGQSSEASSSVPSSTPIPTDGSVSVISQNSVTQSPAVAQGTLTYVPPPAPSSTSVIDVSSLPASLPALNFTASSNFTLPSATATATWNALPSLVSTPYQMVLADTSNLPDYDWNLALPAIPQKQRDALCAQQVAFCAKAGCEDPDAKLTNFCDAENMGSACSCSKGASRLQQYHWPVMLADCRGRNTACKDACIKPNTGTADINVCKTACDTNYGNNCGAPGQYAANYAVRKKGNKPSYSIVQGGKAQNSASHLVMDRMAPLAAAALVVLAVVV